MRLPNPTAGHEQSWVTEHLGHLSCDLPRRSSRFAGTQAAATAAFDAFNVLGYANARNEVWPADRRGASGLSPYIRHGLLTLPQLWWAVGGQPPDTDRFREELLWQEYARHIYARLGTGMRSAMRFEVPGATPPERSAPSHGDPWDRTMACVDASLEELEGDGWMVNQARMWLASQWTVRHKADWRTGEDRFFTHLLDGSRAANRLGWQQTVGAITGKASGFTQQYVKQRAPGLCTGCSVREACPIKAGVPMPDLADAAKNPRLRNDASMQRTGGPEVAEVTDSANAVWLTAESLGDADPALAAHPGLRAVFVFDEPLLARLKLSGKRLIFLADRLAELSAEREVEIYLGSPAEVLGQRAVATTFAPVPGWRTLRPKLNVVEVQPWPWLIRPSSGPIITFAAWNTRLPKR